MLVFRHMVLKPKWWRYPCGGKTQSTNCLAPTRSHAALLKHRIHTQWLPLKRQLHLKSTLLTTWRTRWETITMCSTLELCSSEAKDSSLVSSSIRARHGSGSLVVAVRKAVTHMISSTRSLLRPSCGYQMIVRTCTMSTDQPRDMSLLIVSVSVLGMMSVLTTCSFLRWTAPKNLPWPPMVSLACPRGVPL